MPLLRIVYSRHYNIGLAGLEKLHPFDSRKSGRAWRVLRRRYGGRVKGLRLAPAGPASDEQLLRVHTPDYLRRRAARASWPATGTCWTSLSAAGCRRSSC